MSWEDSLPLGCADCAEQQEAWAEVERLRELQSATRRYIECCRSATKTPYIKKNGRHGKSPWAELIEAAEAQEEPKQ